MVHWNPLRLCNVRILWWRSQTDVFVCAYERDAAVTSMTVCPKRSQGRVYWWKTCVSVETSLAGQNKRTLCKLRERGEEEGVYLSQCVLCLPSCAFIKTKSSLASQALSVISYSSKTKGNGPHFLLELIVPDLYALKAQRRKSETAGLLWMCPSYRLVWLPGRPPLPASVPLSPSLSSEAGVHRRLRLELWRRSHHSHRHTSEVLDFMLPWRSRESTCCGDKDP